MDKKKRVEIKLSGAAYPKEAVISTCCQFLADNYVFLEKAGVAGDIKVILDPKEDTSRSARALNEAFQNELISNTLRYSVSQRNKDLRDYIIKSALVFSQSSGAQSSSALEDIERDSRKFVSAQGDDWKDDPLGIAVPWEDKKNKKSKAKKKRC